MLPPLRIAVAQPSTSTGDLAANAAAHADAVRRAGARLVAFPELSLTGYSYAAPSVATDDEVWAPIVEACAATGAIALVGAPAAAPGGRRSIAVFAVDGTGVVVRYRKTWLGADELRHFEPGVGPAVLDVDGWRVGLGICRDTGTRRHVDDMAALGVDLYVAGLVHAPEDLDEQDARGRRIAAATGAFVGFTSFAGSTAEGYDRTAGTSTIWSPDGEVLTRTGVHPGAIAVSRLDRGEEFDEDVENGPAAPSQGQMRRS